MYNECCLTRGPPSSPTKKKNSQIKMKTPSTTTCCDYKVKTRRLCQTRLTKTFRKRKTDRQQSKKEEGNPSWISQVKFEA